MPAGWHSSNVLGQTTRPEGQAALLALVKTEKKAAVVNAAIAARSGLMTVPKSPRYCSPNIPT